MSKVFLVGASQEARTVANLLMDANPLVDIEVLADRGYGEIGTTFHGLRIIGFTEALAEMPVTGQLVFTNPDPVQRAAALTPVLSARQEKRVWPIRSVKAPTAVIASSAKIGVGSIVMPGALIMDGAELGSHVMIGSGVIVGAEARVCDFATLQAGVVLGAKAYVGKGGLCGLAAVVSANRRVGAWSQVLDGFHLRKDLAPGKTT